MKIATYLVFMFIVLGATPTLALETVVVRLRSTFVPQSLRAFSPRTILPSNDASAKIQDQIQSRAQRDAYEALRRYVVLTLPESVSAKDIQAIDDVVDVRPLLTMRIHEEPLTNDSLSADQYALSLLNATAAWRIATGKGVIVGVIDTGIDWTHEDLVGAMALSAKEDINNNGRFDDWPNTFEINGVFGDLNDIDDDDNGVADDVIGYDFVDQAVRNFGDDRTRDPIPFDEQGHGTSVAGVIAATPNNRKGIAGLAHGARLRAVRAFDATGNAEEDDIASALVYCALTGVNVVNMSFGDGVNSPMLRDAVLFAASMNVILIASAGNTGTTSRQYPAGYDNVIAVGSTNEEDRRSPFSSTGSLVALCAPGERIATTAVNSRYRTVNGTSFSAPYVAAAAAMMIEQSSTISSAEIRGTLQERSLDLGERGWDIFYGAGRIQVDAALQSVARTSFRISSPTNEMEIDARTAPLLAIIGSVLVAPFDSFTVDIGNGIEPTTWTTINSSDVAILNDTLAQLNVVTRVSGLYTLRLRVYCKDGRTLDDRKRIAIVNDEILTILRAEIINAWTTDRRSPVVSLRSSRPTSLSLNITADNVLQFTDVQRFVRSHSIEIPDTMAAQTQYEVVATCKADNGSTVDTTLAIAASQEGAPTVRGWSTVASEQWAGYVLNDVRDMYGDGAPTILMNDLSSGSFGSTFTMQYRNGLWSRRDSLISSWIPRGISDANGNGLLEVLMHVVGRAVLFEQSTVGGSPFARIIFADSSGQQNGAGVADINGDGREELLLLSDSGCTAITFRNGAFEKLGFANNPSQPSFGNSNNRVDEISIGAGDFDGDGKMEVAFGDTDGDLIVSEWDGRAFVNRFTLETAGGGGSGYVASGDVDGDGRPDVAFGVPDSTQPDAAGEYGRNVWTYRLIRATSNDIYETMWKDHFSGVRYGIGYRSGVGLGNLNRIPGNEVVICVYPRMYVFGYDAATQRIATQWYVPDVVCPRLLIYDFNKNGMNELGYGITEAGLGIMTGFRFSEIDTASRHPAPTSLRGHYSNADTISLDWMPVTNSFNYIVYSSINSGPFRKLDSTTTTSVITAVPNGISSIRYEVAAFPVDASIRESQRSNVVAFTIGPIVRPVRLDRDTVLTTELLRGLQIEVLYNGDIHIEHLEPTQYRLVNKATGSYLLATSAVAGTQKSVLVTFETFTSPTQLSLVVAPRTDTRERPTLRVSFDIVVQSAPSETPDFALASLSALTNTSLRLKYTTNVDASALIQQNYTLSPVGSIVSCTRVNGNTVELQLHPASPLTARGITYALTATGIVGDPSGVITRGAGNTATFIVTADEVREAYVYPHPVRLSRDLEITFGGLTKDATVEVLDGSMRSLILLTSSEGNGGVRWDLRTALGVVISPGLYFYRVRDTVREGQDVLKKLFIER